MEHGYHQPQSSENSEFQTESVPQNQAKVSPTSTNTHRVCMARKSSRSVAVLTATFSCTVGIRNKQPEMNGACDLRIARQW